MQLYWPHNLTTSGLASFSICSWHCLKKKKCSGVSTYAQIDLLHSMMKLIEIHKGAMFVFQILLILSAQLFWLGAAQTCYWPDKSIAEELTSCNSMAENSHCCGANSLCLDNGYCFNQGNKYGNRISRGGCTDKSWDSDACPQYCQTTISDGGISISLVSESENDSKFCCGVGYDSSSQLCLANSTSNSFRPFSIDIGVAILNRTSGATALDNTTSEVTTGNTTTAAASPSSQGPYVNIGIAIGAGAGAAVGILLVSAAIIFLCRFRKRQAHHSFQKFDSKNSYPPTPQKYIEHVELEHSPRQFQGLGIQELEGHR
ncbi:hypothetical protein D6C82_02130 [Aureobasidium pullulans]|nr:hypothetical protein D6C82_02130 [Aureobasidium pullulans]